MTERRDQTLRASVDAGATPERGASLIARARSSSSGSARPLVIGNIALSFHAAAAAVTALTIERHGLATSAIAAPHEQMFAMLDRGEVDLLVTAWLPASHGRYLEPQAHKIRKLAVLYRPYCIWGVPDTVPAAEVASVTDLARPEVAAGFRKRIQGIGEGAGISRFSRAIIASYGLDRLGFHFENGSLEDCAGAFEEAVGAGERCIVPLWHPQFLHHRHRIRELAEPKGLLGGVDDAVLLIREEVADRLDPAVLDALTQLHIGNETLAMLDYAINREDLTAREAAARWLAEAG